MFDKKVERGDKKIGVFCMMMMMMKDKRKTKQQQQRRLGRISPCLADLPPSDASLRFWWSRSSRRVANYKEYQNVMFNIISDSDHGIPLPS